MSSQAIFDIPASDNALASDSELQRLRLVEKDSDLLKEKLKSLEQSNESEANLKLQGRFEQLQEMSQKDKQELGELKQQLWQLKMIAEEHSNCPGKINQQNERIVQLAKEKSSNEEQIAKLGLEQQLAQLKWTSSSTSVTLDKWRTKLTENVGTISQLQEENSQLAFDLSIAEGEVRSSQVSAARQAAKIEQLQTDLNSSRSSQSAAESKCAVLQNTEQRVVELDSEIASIRADNETLQQEVNAGKRALRIAVDAEHRATSSVTTLETELYTEQSNASILKTDLNSCKRELKNAKESLGTAQSQLNEAVRQRSEIVSARASLEAEIIRIKYEASNSQYRAVDKAKRELRLANNQVIAEMNLDLIDVRLKLSDSMNENAQLQIKASKDLDAVLDSAREAESASKRKLLDEMAALRENKSQTERNFAAEKRNSAEKQKQLESLQAQLKHRNEETQAQLAKHDEQMQAQLTKHDEDMQAQLQQHNDQMQAQLKQCNEETARANQSTTQLRFEVLDILDQPATLADEPEQFFDAIKAIAQFKRKVPRTDR